MLVYVEVFDDMAAAIARKKQIKAGSRRKKMALYQTSEFLTLNLGFHDFTDVILLTN